MAVGITSCHCRDQLESGSKALRCSAGCVLGGCIRQLVGLGCFRLNWSLWRSDTPRSETPAGTQELCPQRRVHPTSQKSPFLRDRLLP